MAAEHKVVEHVNEVEGIVLVLLSQVFQNADLFLSLPMKAFLVSDHLERNMLVTFVIVSFHDLTKTALAYHLEHLVPVGQVVMRDVSVRALIVIVATIVGRANDARPLLGVGANEVDLRVVEDFVMLVRSQFVHVKLHDLLRRCNHCLWLEAAGAAATAIGTVVVGASVDRSHNRLNIVLLLLMNGALHGGNSDRSIDNVAGTDVDVVSAVASVGDVDVHV